jgi:hypothetical protein
MDSAGIIPEEDMQDEGEELAEADLPEIGSERLSVFEDFLENLEVDEDEDEENGGEQVN